jgi:hypothetical protein
MLFIISYIIIGFAQAIGLTFALILSISIDFRVPLAQAQLLQRNILVICKNLTISLLRLLPQLIWYFQFYPHIFLWKTYPPYLFSLDC